MSARASLAAATTLCLALAGCSSSPTLLRTDEVGAAIVSGLSEQFPQRQFSAVCPPEVEAAVGGVFTCEVTDASDGSIAVVTVTQTTADGGVSWEVTQVDVPAADDGVE